MSEKKENLVMKKFKVIFFTLLILLIPLLLFNVIVNERKDYNKEAVKKVTASWASAQILSPPKLFFKENVHVYFPENSSTDVKLNTTYRKVGIFKVPVYKATVKMKGNFNLNGDYMGKTAYLSFDVSDSKGFVKQPHFKFNNISKSQNSKILITILNPKSRNIPYEINYEIRGIDEISVKTLGKNNVINISGNWKDPSFGGTFLPSDKIINKNGFSAKWNIPEIAAQESDAKCTVSLLTPVDNYRMTLRAVKYGILFLGLTFIAYFVFEIASREKRRIHPLQYTLIGLGLLVFYLLLLSMSELMPFSFAYLIASLMTITLISLYTFFVITKKQSKKFPALIAAILSLLYGFLYVLLMLQDLSLIVGSLALFVVIAIVMYATKDINWYLEEE